MYLFHATPRDNVASIHREGLIGTEEWGHDEDEPSPTLVHVMDCAVEAREWVAQLYQLPEEDLHVFAVDVTDLEILPGLDGPPAYALADSVEPWRVHDCHQPELWARTEM